MNEMVSEGRQRDHVTAELLCLKTEYQQTNTRLVDAQQVLAGKVAQAILSAVYNASIDTFLSVK